MNRSRRILSSLGFAIAVAITAPACVFTASGHMAGGGTMYATEAPPPDQPEQYGTRPGYVWVRGHWSWQGSWVWTAGHWERERAGYAWQDGRWEQQGNQWVWTDGNWYQGGAHGTVTVHDDGYGNTDRPRVEDHRDGGGTTVVVVNDGYPHQAPPAPQTENPGTRSGYVWVMGRWDWQSNQWQWTPGHWERARARQVWHDGHWEQRGDRWEWVEGSWEAGASGTIEVHDRRTH